MAHIWKPGGHCNFWIHASEIETWILDDPRDGTTYPVVDTIYWTLLVNLSFQILLPTGISEQENWQEDDPVEPICGALKKYHGYLSHYNKVQQLYLVWAEIGYSCSTRNNLQTCLFVLSASFSELTAKEAVADHFVFSLLLTHPNCKTLQHVNGVACGPWND